MNEVVTGNKLVQCLPDGSAAAPRVGGTPPINSGRRQTRGDTVAGRRSPMPRSRTNIVVESSDAMRITVHSTVPRDWNSCETSARNDLSQTYSFNSVHVSR